MILRIPGNSNLFFLHHKNYYLSGIWKHWPVLRQWKWRGEERIKSLDEVELADLMAERM